MRISAQMSLVAGIAFALVCFGIAIHGFLSMAEMTDATQIADARGFAGFWSFLGVVGATMAAVSLWMLRTARDEDA